MITEASSKIGAKNLGCELVHTYLRSPFFKPTAGIAVVYKNRSNEQITFHYQTCERGYR